MNPQQPVQPPQAPAPLNTNQYDFINQSPQQPGRKFSLGGGTSGKLKIIAIGLGVFTVLVLLFSLLFSGGGGDNDTLLKIAKSQSKVIAVAEIGADKAGSNQAQSIAYNTLLSVTSGQNDVVGLISKNGKKLKKKDYAAIVDTKVENDLTQAETNGRFDEAFLNEMKTSLETYQSELKSNFSKIKGPGAKQTVSNSYDDASLLITSITK